MDKFLLIVGLIIAILIIATGGFGLFGQVFQGTGPGGGFSFFPSGPLATGPNGVTDSNITGIVPESSNTGTQSQAKTVSGNAAAKNPSELIRISNVTRPFSNAQGPADEYVAVRHMGGSGEPAIAISGWTIGNSQGKRYPVGVAQKIAFFDFAAAVFLKPGEEAYLHTGPSPFGQNFQENACTGYLNQSYRFNPGLNESCPRQEFRNLLQFKDACIQFLEQRVSSCRIPQVTSQDAQRIGDECGQYIAENLNYAGCVRNYRLSADFYKGRWHIYLGRTEKLWRELHDIITLYDQAGRVVSIYQY